MGSSICPIGAARLVSAAASSFAASCAVLPFARGGALNSFAMPCASGKQPSKRSAAAPNYEPASIDVDCPFDPHHARCILAAVSRSIFGGSVTYSIVQ
jgi:hypothetical protein